MTIGILGGGQLGYMLALAGYPLGLHFRFFDPSPEAPVGRIASRVTAEFSDQSALEKFASGLELFPALENYFHFYNHQRPHQALGYQTPADLFPHKPKRKKPFT